MILTDAFQVKIFYGSMINFPVAVVGVVRAETDVHASQCLFHPPPPPLLTRWVTRLCRSLAEHGVQQQRTKHFHFAPAWEIPAARRKVLIPGELCQGQGWCRGSARGSRAPTWVEFPWQQVLPALLHQVPFLQGDVATVCTEVLLFGRSRALSPRPLKFKQLDAHAR